MRIRMKGDEYEEKIGPYYETLAANWASGRLRVWTPFIWSLRNDGFERIKYIPRIRVSWRLPIRPGSSGAAGCP